MSGPATVETLRALRTSLNKAASCGPYGGATVRSRTTTGMYATSTATSPQNYRPPPRGSIVGRGTQSAPRPAPPRGVGPNCNVNATPNVTQRFDATANGGEAVNGTSGCQCGNGCGGGSDCCWNGQSTHFCPRCCALDVLQQSIMLQKQSTQRPGSSWHEVTREVEEVGEGLKHLVIDKERHISSLLAEVSRYKEQLFEYKTNLEASKRKEEELRAQISSMDQTIQNLRQQLSQPSSPSKPGSLADESAELQRLKAELQKKNAKIETLTKGNQHLQQQISQLQKGFESLSRKVEIQQLEQSSSLGDDFNRREAEKIETRVLLQTAQEELKQHKAQTAALQSNVKQLQLQVQRHDEATEELQHTIAELEQQKAQLNSTSEELQQRIADLEETNQIIVEQLKQRDSRIQELEQLNSSDPMRHSKGKSSRDGYNNKTRATKDDSVPQNTASSGGHVHSSSAQHSSSDQLRDRDQRIKELEQMARSKDETISKLAIASSRLPPETSKLELMKAKETIADLESKLKAAEADIAQQAKHEAQLAHEVGTHKAEIDMMEKEFFKLQSTTTIQHREISLLEKQLQSKDEKMAKQAEDVIKLQKNVAQLTDRMRTQLQNFIQAQQANAIRTSPQASAALAALGPLLTSLASPATSGLQIPSPVTQTNTKATTEAPQTDQQTTNKSNSKAGGPTTAPPAPQPPRGGNNGNNAATSHHHNQQPENVNSVSGEWDLNEGSFNTNTSGDHQESEAEVSQSGRTPRYDEDQSQSQDVSVSVSAPQPVKKNLTSRRPSQRNPNNSSTGEDLETNNSGEFFDDPGTQDDVGASQINSQDAAEDEILSSE
ncbi:hypothetical protein Pelo_3551 [Pelomyxa schiedti]|nr:hypothetical protein Pelo_3551 [Pelomyxa schiedti]